MKRQPRQRLSSRLFPSDPSPVKRVFEVTGIVPSETTPLETFSGFSRLKAITYSYSLSFLGEIAKNFDEIEVIVGSPKTLTVRNTESLLSVAEFGLECSEEREIAETIGRAIKAYPNLISVRMRIALGRVSHEKLYLLEDDSGRRRTVFGSGNLSSMAFGQRQDEGFYFSDIETAYAFHNEIYLDLLSRSEPFSARLLKLAKDGEDVSTVIRPQDLPIVQLSKDKEMESISAKDPGLARAIRVIVPPGTLPEAPPRMTHGEVKDFARQCFRPQAVQEKPVEERFSRIMFDFEAGLIRKDEVILCDLSVSPEELKSDVEMIRSWFDSYRQADFSGNRDFAVRGFELLLSYALVSPFLPILHHEAAKAGRGGFQYPLVAILFGPSSGGKTSFIECLRPLTFRVPEETAGMKFTQASMDKYRFSSGQGLLIKDDVASKPIKAHLDPIVKKDEEMKTNIMAPVIISTNKDVLGFDAAILKRAIPVYIDAHARGSVRSIHVNKLGHGLLKAFIAEFRPIFQARLQGQENGHILVDASRVLAELIPDLKPFTDEEIDERRFASFRKRFECIYAEKRRDNSCEVTADTVWNRFDNAEAAKTFYDMVPEETGATLGDKGVGIPIKGLEGIGIKIDFMGDSLQGVPENKIETGFFSRVKRLFS